MISVGELLDQKGHGVWHVTPDDTVYNAIKLMDEKGVGALVVLDEDGGLVGMISERDYARKVILLGRASKDTKVSDIMTSKVYYTFPSQSVEDCMVVMTERRIRHLPVLKGEEIIGMISLGDVVKDIIAEQKFLIDQLEHYIAGEDYHT